MQIQVNTDRNIPGHELLVTQVEETVRKSLQHFESQITRVEVHLSDENGDKAGANDKRCVMEARLEGHQPLAASHQAESLRQAYVGAANKLKTALGNTRGKLSTR